MSDSEGELEKVRALLNRQKSKPQQQNHLVGVPLPPSANIGVVSDDDGNETGRSSDWMSDLSSSDDDDCSDEAEDLVEVEPAHSQFLTFQARLRSFALRTREMPASDELARAGFFFDPFGGHSDRTTCFQCGISMLTWNNDDDPLFSHLRAKRNCTFVLSMGDETDSKLAAVKGRQPVSGLALPASPPPSVVHTSILTSALIEEGVLDPELPDVPPPELPDVSTFSLPHMPPPSIPDVAPPDVPDEPPPDLPDGPPPGLPDVPPPGSHEAPLNVILNAPLLAIPKMRTSPSVSDVSVLPDGISTLPSQNSILPERSASESSDEDLPMAPAEPSVLERDLVEKKKHTSHRNNSQSSKDKTLRSKKSSSSRSHGRSSRSSSKADGSERSVKHSTSLRINKEHASAQEAPNDSSAQVHKTRDIKDQRATDPGRRSERPKKRESDSDKRQHSSAKPTTLRETRESKSGKRHHPSSRPTTLREARRGVRSPDSDEPDTQRTRAALGTNHQTESSKPSKERVDNVVTPGNSFETLEPALITEITPGAVKPDEFGAVRERSKQSSRSSTLEFQEQGDSEQGDVPELQMKADKSRSRPSKREHGVSRLAKKTGSKASLRHGKPGSSVKDESKASLRHETSESSVKDDLKASVRHAKSASSTMVDSKRSLRPKKSGSSSEKVSQTSLRGNSASTANNGGLALAPSNQPETPKRSDQNGHSGLTPKASVVASPNTVESQIEEAKARMFAAQADLEQRKAAEAAAARDTALREKELSKQMSKKGSQLNIGGVISSEHVGGARIQSTGGGAVKLVLSGMLPPEYQSIFERLEKILTEAGAEALSEKEAKWLLKSIPTILEKEKEQEEERRRRQAAGMASSPAQPSPRPARPVGDSQLVAKLQVELGRVRKRNDVLTANERKARREIRRLRAKLKEAGDTRGIDASSAPENTRTEELELKLDEQQALSEVKDRRIADLEAEVTYLREQLDVFGNGTVLDMSEIGILPPHIAEDEVVASPGTLLAAKHSTFPTEPQTVSASLFVPDAPPQAPGPPPPPPNTGSLSVSDSTGGLLGGLASVKLKSAEASSPKESEPAGSPGDLLASIRSGAKLRHVATSEINQKSEATEDDSVLGAIARALIARRTAIEEDDDEENSDDADLDDWL